MADIGGLLVYTFGKWLTPLLLVAHTGAHCDGFIGKEEEETSRLDPIIINKDDV
jgi:hypothetical protein